MRWPRPLKCGRCLFRRPQQRSQVPNDLTRSATAMSSPTTCKVMDGAAIALARDNKLPVIVFSITEPGYSAQGPEWNWADDRGLLRVYFCRTCACPTGRRSQKTSISTVMLVCSEPLRRSWSWQPPHLMHLSLNREWSSSVEALRREFSGLRTGPCQRQVARSCPSYCLRLQDAAQSGGHSFGSRTTEPFPFKFGTNRMSGPVEKGIREANLGLNPVIDGALIRLPIPDADSGST